MPMGCNDVWAPCLWKDKSTNKALFPKFRESYSVVLRLACSFLNPGLYPAYFHVNIQLFLRVASLGHPWHSCYVPMLVSTAIQFQAVSSSRQPLSIFDGTSPRVHALTQLPKSLPACSYSLSIKPLLGEEAALWAAMSSMRHLSHPTTDGLAPVPEELPFPEQLAFAIVLSPQPPNCSSSLMTGLRHDALELKVFSLQHFMFALS